MSYNEYAQLLETKNPATGKLYTADDFATIDWNDEGVAMLQDAIWANTSKLKDTKYADQTVKFIAASLKGWAFCRDNVDKCRDITVAAGSTLGASHQQWQINEVNKLIWPSPDGIGMIDQAAWDRTVTIAKETKNQEGATVLTKDPDADAYSTEYVTKALDLLKSQGLDMNGSGYTAAGDPRRGRQITRSPAGIVPATAGLERMVAGSVFPGLPISGRTS